MMKKSISKLIVFLFILLFSSQAFAKTAGEWAEELGFDRNISYDATRTIETKDGRITGKVHHAPGKQMSEMNISGMQTRVIIREDLGKSYSTMPSMSAYTESDLEQGLQKSGQSMNLKTMEKVGTETVNGFAATKYKTQFQDESGKGAGFIWFTDHGINIKSDMIYATSGAKGTHMRIELTNLHLRAQDPNLFEVPPGLQRMDMGMIPGMMGRQQQAQGTGNANANPGATDKPNQDPSIAEDMGTAAKDETRRGMVNETRDAVKKGLKGLFGK